VKVESDSDENETLDHILEQKNKKEAASAKAPIASSIKGRKGAVKGEDDSDGKAEGRSGTAKAKTIDGTSRAALKSTPSQAKSATPTQNGTKRTATRRKDDGEADDEKPMKKARVEVKKGAKKASKIATKSYSSDDETPLHKL
jgi:hypothetical protein